MPVFPSVEWFQAVADLVNEDPEYRKLGTCDALVGIEVGDRTFVLNFEAFDVGEIRETANPEGEDLDFTLVMTPERWREMLENIREEGHATLEHTLNTIDLASPEEFARAEDYYRRDLFYRFNQSFQHFFDASARVPTEFAEPARA